MTDEPIRTRLDAIDARLVRIEEVLAENERLRAALQYESEGRRALAEQVTWLLELLGESRKDGRWLRSKLPPQT